MPEIVSLIRARVRGLPRYFTGKPCKHGHLAERRTGDGHCIECKNLCDRVWQVNNREKLTRYVRDRRRNDPESSRQSNRKWKRNNVDRVKQYLRDWKENNSERSRQTSKTWRENNLERVNRNYKIWSENNPERRRLIRARRKARKLNQSGVVSPDIIDCLLEKQDYECAYSLHWCKVDFLFERFHVDHVMPLALGGLHEDSNLQLLCPKCNMSKGAKHPDVFVLQELERRIKLRSSK